MKVELYTIDSCTYCDQSKKLLQDQNCEYTEYLITQETFDVIISNLRQRLGAEPTALPMIFVDNAPIGGYDALVKWLNNQGN